MLPYRVLNRKGGIKMRKQVQIRMDEDKVNCLRDWAERKRMEESFSLNTWLAGRVEDGMLKEGIL
jgi:hypothetical protein